MSAGRTHRSKSGAETNRQGRFAQRQALLVSQSGYLCRLVVADVRGQAGHQHQAVVQVFGHALAVGLQAAQAVLAEVVAAIGQQLHGLQEVEHDDRLEHVELQLSLAGGDADRQVVAQNLAGQHRQRLALGWIDLARHDRTAWFVGGQSHFGKPCARPGGQQTKVVGQFHEGAGQCLQRAGKQHQWFMSGERGELCLER